MNICCIYTVEDYVTTEKPLPCADAISFGISYIATVLKNAGHNVTLMVLTPDSDLNTMLGNYMSDKGPALFCLTSVTTQFPLICRITEIIKRIDRKSYIVLGGHYVTLFPQALYKFPYIDCICIGEGEDPIIKLANKLENNEPITNINNLWIRKSESEIERNEMSRFIEDLDSLPLIDRSMWMPWISDPHGPHSVLLGRGCPNSCTYCSNHRLAMVAKGRYVRLRSPDNLIMELENIMNNKPSVRTIYLEVETLGANIDYAYILLDKLKEFNLNRESPIKFGCNIAVTGKVVDNEELIIRLKEANFDFVNIGLESGSKKIRREVLKRPPYSNEDLLRFCRLVKKHSIKIFLFLMVGIPGEKLSDFKETIRCTREIIPYDVHLSIFYPYPGTKLYDFCKKTNLISSDMPEVSLERKKAVLDLPGFSKREIQRQYRMFYYSAFHGIWPLTDIIPLVVRACMRSITRFARIYQKVIRLVWLRRSLGIMKRIFSSVS
jgi:radical SAM superfamily enzyme YgiQ (UPF0313 family)